MTASAIEHLRELREKATAGKWLAPDTSEGDVWDMRLDGEPGIPLMRSERGNYRSWGRSLDNHERSANAAAIVAAINALPALLECAEALERVLAACDQGRVVERGHGGMTIDAQIRRSVINGVPAMPVEEARAALDALAAQGEKQ